LNAGTELFSCLCVGLFMAYVISDTRLEDKVYLKLDKKPPERQSNTELLGIAMVDAGREIGPVSSYGKKW